MKIRELTNYFSENWRNIFPIVGRFAPKSYDNDGKMASGLIETAAGMYYFGGKEDGARKMGAQTATFEPKAGVKKGSVTKLSNVDPKKAN